MPFPPTQSLPLRIPALPGDAVVITSTLTLPPPSVVAPDGTVQFQLDGSPDGPAVTLSNGIASYTNSTLSHGYHTIESDYAGTTNLDGSTNIVGSTNSISQLINTPPTNGPVTFSRTHDSSLLIAISDVFTNVGDPDGDPVTLVAVDAFTTNGASIYTNSTEIYYSPPGTNGNVTDTFNYVVADSYGAMATSTITVTIAPDYNGPAVNITGITNNSGVVTVSFAGIPGLSYIIQAATNLTSPITWTNLGTNIADTNSGRFSFSDTNASNYSTGIIEPRLRPINDAAIEKNL